jgi:septation ring formation regulator EzrA
MAQILVEVRPTAEAGDLTGQPAIPENFINRVDEIGQSLQEIADRLSQHLEHFEKRESTWRLDQVELKFSLDLEAEAGVVIAKAKTTAGFEASLSWKSGSA